ncbi:hypothetical protein AGMMS49546_23540 [Spirochaetia bacterium]|nr:hypothetical protein AGMMS49546_23540 [Spirochaetia bacterium]
MNRPDINKADRQSGFLKRGGVKKNFPASWGLLLWAAALLFSLPGCQTLQKDRLVPGMDTAAQGELADLEELIVRLDKSDRPREDAAPVRRKIAELEKKSIPDGDFQARLAAWSGRLYLLEGKNSEAQRELKNSQALSPLNPVSVILSARLERDLQKRLALIDNALLAESAGGSIAANSIGELQIERGRTLFDLNRFSEAVAAFDTAFARLGDRPFYEESCRIYRDKAWELRDIAVGTENRTVTIIQQGLVSWRDLIELTQAETELLRFLTAGRDWSAEEIFTRLLDRGFIPVTQDITLNEWPAVKPRSGETVLRSGAAWFLWRLYAENRANRGLLSRYSSRYAGMNNPRSPIADLPLLSPYFDSVMGCVESEFLALPDGKNFIPREAIRGSEFLGALRKLNP